MSQYDVATVTTNRILSNLNADNDTYSLKRLIDNENLIQDEEPILLDHSPYVDNETLIDIIKEKQGILKCLSLNIQSLNAKFDQLRLYLDYLYDENCIFDLIYLQETWVNDNINTDMFQLDGYQLISQSCTSTTHGGLAIYVSDKIRYEKIEINFSNSNTWEGLFLRLFLTEGKCVTAGNIYRPPRYRIDDYNTFITEFDCVLKMLTGEVIIGGDINIDLLKINEKPIINEYYETLLSNGFTPKITYPTRLTRNNGTLIDNFFCKISKNFSKTTSGICTFKLSDHQPYFICLDFLSLKQNKTKFIEIYKQDENSVRQFCNYLDNQNISEKLRNIEDPNECYDILENLLKKGIELYMPKIKVKFNRHKHKKTPWITNGLVKSIKFRDKLYLKLKTTPTESTLYNQLKVNLGTYNKILKKAIREAKQEYYNTQFFKHRNDMKNTWKTIRNVICKTNKNQDIPNSFLINGNTINNKETIANEFNSFFTNIGKNLASKITPPQNKEFHNFLSNPCSSILNFQHISAEDILKIIKSLKSKSSKSHDNMSSILLKQIKNHIAEPLTIIINKTIDSGIFPDKLKIARVLPIYKKDNNSLLENYRPISILPAISKIFEKVILIQINQYFSNNNLYYSSQYGFRQSHSTELAVLEIVDKIAYQMDQDNIPLNIYIDLSKAFDTIDHKILLHKLKYYGLNANSSKLIENYLTNRKQYVDFQSIQSSFLPISTGVPQGSILGPLLFIIYLNDISQASPLFNCISYADDTTLFISLNCDSSHSCFPNSICLNNELKKISEWLALNKLSLNVPKTKAMLFHNPKKRITPPDLKIGNSNIEYVDSFPLLGIIIDKNLNWTQHINHISKKISKTIGILKKVKHYLPTTNLKTIYNSLINSHINFGILCWGYNAKNILKLQKKAIRLVCNCKYNAHTQPLFKKLHILTVNDILTLKLYKFYYRLYHKKVPDYFQRSISPSYQQDNHTYNTRHQLYVVPRIKHKFCECNLRYQLPIQLNKNIRCITDKVATHSEYGLCQYIKKYLINNYEINCNSASCFVCRPNLTN